MNFQPLRDTIQLYYLRNHHHAGSPCVRNDWHRKELKEEIIDGIGYSMWRFHIAYNGYFSFRGYKLVVSADEHCTTNEPHPHWTIRMYNPVGRRDATIHILGYKTATVERRNVMQDETFDQLSDVFCFCHRARPGLCTTIYP